MGAMSPIHWLIVIAVVLLLFGGKKIPELAKGLGEGLKEFKKAQRDGEKEAATDAAKKEDSATPPAATPPKQS